MNSAQDLFNELKSTTDPYFLYHLAEISKTLALSAKTDEGFVVWSHLRANTDSFVFNTSFALAVLESEEKDIPRAKWGHLNEALEEYKKLLKETFDLLLKTISSTQLILSQQTKED